MGLVVTRLGGDAGLPVRSDVGRFGMVDKNTLRVGMDDNEIGIGISGGAGTGSVRADIADGLEKSVGGIPNGIVVDELSVAEEGVDEADEGKAEVDEVSGELVLIGVVGKNVTDEDEDASDVVEGLVVLVGTVVVVLVNDVQVEVG